MSSTRGKGLYNHPEVDRIWGIKGGSLEDSILSTWTSKMANIMDPILPILPVLGYWAIILGSFGGPGTR